MYRLLSLSKKIPSRSYLPRNTSLLKRYHTTKENRQAPDQLSSSHPDASSSSIKPQSMDFRGVDLNNPNVQQAIRDQIRDKIANSIGEEAVEMEALSKEIEDKRFEKKQADMLKSQGFDIEYDEETQKVADLITNVLEVREIESQMNWTPPDQRELDKICEDYKNEYGEEALQQATMEIRMNVWDAKECPERIEMDPTLEDRRASDLAESLEELVSSRITSADMPDESEKLVKVLDEKIKAEKDGKMKFFLKLFKFYNTDSAESDSPLYYRKSANLFPSSVDIEKTFGVKVPEHAQIWPPTPHPTEDYFMMLVHNYCTTPQKYTGVKEVADAIEKHKSSLVLEDEVLPGVPKSAAIKAFMNEKEPLSELDRFRDMVEIEEQIRAERGGLSGDELLKKQLKERPDVEIPDRSEIEARYEAIKAEQEKLRESRLERVNELLCKKEEAGKDSAKVDALQEELDHFRKKSRHEIFVLDKKLLLQQYQLDMVKSMEERKKVQEDYAEKALQTEDPDKKEKYEAVSLQAKADIEQLSQRLLLGITNRTKRIRNIEIPEPPGHVLNIWGKIQRLAELKKQIAIKRAEIMNIGPKDNLYSERKPHLEKRVAIETKDLEEEADALAKEIFTGIEKTEEEIDSEVRSDEEYMFHLDNMRIMDNLKNDGTFIPFPDDAPLKQDTYTVSSGRTYRRVGGHFVLVEEEDAKIDGADSQQSDIIHIKRKDPEREKILANPPDLKSGSREEKLKALDKYLSAIEQNLTLAVEDLNFGPDHISMLADYMKYRTEERVLEAQNLSSSEVSAKKEALLKIFNIPSLTPDNILSYWEERVSDLEAMIEDHKKSLEYAAFRGWELELYSLPTPAMIKEEIHSHDNLTDQEKSKLTTIIENFEAGPPSVANNPDLLILQDSHKDMKDRIEEMRDDPSILEKAIQDPARVAVLHDIMAEMEGFGEEGREMRELREAVADVEGNTKEIEDSIIQEAEVEEGIIDRHLHPFGPTRTDVGEDVSISITEAKILTLESQATMYMALLDVMVNTFLAEVSQILDKILNTLTEVSPTLVKQSYTEYVLYHFPIENPRRCLEIIREAEKALYGKKHDNSPEEQQAIEECMRLFQQHFARWAGIEMLVLSDPPIHDHEKQQVLFSILNRLPSGEAQELMLEAEMKREEELTKAYLEPVGLGHLILEDSLHSDSVSIEGFPDPVAGSPHSHIPFQHSVPLLYREKLEEYWWDMDIPLYYQPKTLLGPQFGTPSDPVLIPSETDYRVIGCLGGPHDRSHPLRWHVIRRMRPRMVCMECGQVFKMVTYGEWLADLQFRREEYGLEPEQLFERHNDENTEGNWKGEKPYIKTQDESPDPYSTKAFEQMLP